VSRLDGSRAATAPIRLDVPDAAGASIHAQAVYDAHQAVSLARSRTDRVRQLEIELARLVRLASFGSANSPRLRTRR